MTDYLGPLTLAQSGGTYSLASWKFTPADDGTETGELQIVVQAATADTLAAAIDALAAACRAGNTYVHAEPGVTSPVTYEVTACTRFEQNPEVSGWLAFLQQIDVTLILSGRPAGALTTLYNAQAVNAPDALSLSALLGTHPPKLDVTIDDASGNDMHSVHVCLAPRVLTDDQTIALATRAHWLIYASSLTWTTMSNRGATATAWSNDPRYTTSASWQTAPLDTQKYPAGQYKLWARVRQEAGTGYVMDSVNQTAIPVTRTTFHLIEMGDVELPVSDTAYGTASNLTLYVRSDGTNDFDIDAFLLLPLDHGLTYWHPTVDTNEIDQLDIGPTGIFMDGVCDMTYLKGGPLEPAILASHCGTLVATEEPGGSDWPTDWERTDSTDVTADTSRFKVSTTTGSKYAWYEADPTDLGPGWGM
jgi:hypothetical protein